MEKSSVKEKDTILDKKDKMLDKSANRDLSNVSVPGLSWENLIAEARKQIEDANAAIRVENRKIWGLKQSIKYFEKQLEEGEPCFGAESATP